MFRGLIFMRVKFGADPDLYLVNLNVVSYGNCWALVEVCTLLSVLLALLVFCKNTFNC